jgi:small subunit ribosomal protein S5
MTTENATEAKTETKTAAVPVAEKKEERRRPRGGGRRGGNRRRKEPKEFEESILQISRVTRVVKGGRRMRFKVCVVIGDKKGRVGLGTGKSNEVVTSIQKAVAQAKKRLVRVPIFNGTLPHGVVSKYKASKVLLFPAPAGKGIIAGGSVRKMLELAGYKDVLSKIHGSRNKLNVAHATLLALTSMQTVEAKKEEEAIEDVKEKPTKESKPKKIAPKKNVVAKVEKKEDKK